ATDAPGVVLVLPRLGARLTRRRNSESPPRELAAVDVPGADPATGAELSAGALALQDKLLAALSLECQRRSREALGLGCGRAGRGIGRRRGVDFPGQLTVIAIDRDHPHVVGRDEDLVAIHGNAALGARLLDLRIVAPERDRLRAAAHVELHHPAPGVVDVHEA